MIKNGLKLTFIMLLIYIGCSAQKNLLAENINTAANKQPLEDSVLEKLQAENDLVIAYALENFAWVRAIDYRIITQNSDGWKGYIYHKNLMPNNAGSPTSIRQVPVDKTSCDALLSEVTASKAWEFKGDGENGFCADGNKSCNINDAPGSRLWLITKNSAVNSSYYAPEFYERCCPEKQRGLFVSITKKIAAIVDMENETDQ